VCVNECVCVCVCLFICVYARVSVLRNMLDGNSSLTSYVQGLQAKPSVNKFNC